MRFLYDLQYFGIKLGLQNIRSLLAFLDHPEENFPCVHIAGTNGKGSTAAMIASMLTASGYRTGLYTSPHLINFTERIRINGRKISDDDVARYTAILKPKIKKLKATFFEATTAIAFKYFADRQVDIAVVETGLGGRFDATNVVTPLVSIITNIELEHTEHLGTTHARIAFEKGGIIKPTVPCFTGTTNRDAINQLQNIAKSANSALRRSGEISSVSIRNQSLEGSVVNLRTKHEAYRDLFISLAGGHQVQNLQLAILSVEYLKSMEGYARISTRNMRQGLGNIQMFSGLRGRLDVLKQSPLIIADVAHNPDGIRKLVRSLRNLCVDRIITVFGVLKDKDYGIMMENLLPITRLAIGVQARTDRALPATEVVKSVHERRARAFHGNSVKNGLFLAMNECHDGDPLLVVGSHYVVGEAMQVLGIQP